jgi:hypothetical protein
MHTLTIWQPWASLCAIGVKPHETRSFYTSYRGPLLIHSSKKDYVPLFNALPTHTRAEMIAALSTAYDGNDLPLGAIIAKAELVGCYKITSIQEFNGAPDEIGYWSNDGMVWNDPSERDLLFGDWTPGRFAWKLANVKPLDKPIPCKGQQGLWWCREKVVV